MLVCVLRLINIAVCVCVSVCVKRSVLDYCVPAISISWLTADAMLSLATLSLLSAAAAAVFFTRTQQ